MRPAALVAALAVCAVAVAAEPADVVAMIDVSASMAPFFSDVVDYFLGDLMAGMLREGDRFHLLSFAGLPEVEMSAVRIDGAERRALVNKIRLLQPIGLHTDLVRAVLALQAYTAALPASGSRQILLITDGVHDPPPGSPYGGDQTAALSRLLEGARSIRMDGWYVHILGLPSSGGETGRGPQRSLLEPLARELGARIVPYAGRGSRGIEPDAAGLLEVLWPTALGAVGRSVTLPFTFVNRTPREQAFTLERILHAGASLLEAPVSVSVPPGGSSASAVRIVLPAGLPAGSHVLDIRLETSGQARLYPAEGRLNFIFDATPAAAAAPSGSARAAAVVHRGGRGVQAAASAAYRIAASVPVAILVSAALLLIALLLILAVSLHFRRHGSAPPARPVARRLEKGPLVEMQVSLQSSRIGLRNVRGLQPGQRRSVGGGRSAFLIFLVPLPPRIAEISYDGRDYTFRVIRPRYFPGIPQAVPTCLGVDIPLVSDKGFPIVVRFVPYVSPLERIRSLLNAVREPGARLVRQPPPHPPAVDTAHRFL